MIFRPPVVAQPTATGHRVCQSTQFCTSIHVQMEIAVLCSGHLSVWVVCVCFCGAIEQSDVITMLCLVWPFVSVTQQSESVCVFSQTNLLEEVSVACLLCNWRDLGTFRIIFGGIICLSAWSTIRMTCALQSWFLYFYLFAVLSEIFPFFLQQTQHLKTTCSVRSHQPRWDLFWFSTRCNHHTNT